MGDRERERERCVVLLSNARGGGLQEIGSRKECLKRNVSKESESRGNAGGGNSKKAKERAAQPPHVSPPHCRTFFSSFHIDADLAPEEPPCVGQLLENPLLAI